MLSMYFRIWLAFFKNCLSREMEYRGHLFMQFMIDMVWYGVQIGLFEVIYLHTPEVAGFTQKEMLVFLGTLFVTDAVNMMLFSHNFWHFPEYVRTGELDFFLTKPASTFFLTCFRYINIAAIANLCFGVGFLVYAMVQAGLLVSFSAIAWFLVLCFTGLLLNIGLQTAFASIAIWTVAGEGIQYLYHTVFNFASRPDSIYKGYMRRAMLYVFPLGLIASVPARALLGTLDIGLAVWSVFAGVAVLFGALQFFRWSLTKYSGASS